MLGTEHILGVLLLQRLVISMPRIKSQPYFKDSVLLDTLGLMRIFVTMIEDLVISCSSS